MNNALCITTPGLGSFGMRRDSLHAAGRWNGELTARGSRKRCGIGQLRQGDRTAVHVQRTYEGEELANSHKPASRTDRALIEPLVAVNHGIDAERLFGPLASRSTAPAPQRAVHQQPGQRRRERAGIGRSEEHTSELQSLAYLVCRLLLE